MDARRARTFYNVADALVPPCPANGVGAGDVDLAPALERALDACGGAARARLLFGLLLIEWLPRLCGRGLRGFSWLPREARRAELARWAGSRLPWRRAVHAELARVAREGFEAALRARVDARPGGLPR